MNVTPGHVRGDARHGVETGSKAGDTAARARTTSGARGQAARQAALLTSALAVTVCLASLTVLWTSGGTKDLNRAVFFAPFDLVLIAMIGWTLLHRQAVADLFRARAVSLVSLAYVALFGVSLAAHPSWLGASMGFHLMGGVAAIACVSTACSATATRKAVLATIAGAGVFEALLAIAQARHGGPLGIAYLDFGGPLYQFGTSYAGRGGFTHPYHLDLLLVLAEGAAVLGYRTACAVGERNRWGWVAATFVIGCGMGVTYSRTAVIGQSVLVLAALVGRDRRILVPFAAAVVAGLVLTGATMGSGWVDRTSTTKSGANFDSGRRERMSESLILMRSSPLVGVGPGRYVDALAETDHYSKLPSHDLLLQEGAELGVLGYVVSAAFLGLLVLRAWRGGAWTVAVVAPVLPFLLLDSYAYAGGGGLALSAVWLALCRASLLPADLEVEAGEADEADDVTALATAPGGGL